MCGSAVELPLSIEFDQYTRDAQTGTFILFKYSTYDTQTEDMHLDKLIQRAINNAFRVGSFFALHGMPARTSDEKGVRLSVRLSVSQTRAL